MNSKTTFRYGADRLKSSAALALARGELRGELTLDVRDKITAAQQVVEDVVLKGDAIYGINTGFGPLCSTSISVEDTMLLQRNLLISHSVGVGEPISPLLSRLMLVLKIHALAQGHSGVSIALMERLLWHLEEDLIPVVPEQGSVGASGDLAPLSHLFLPLLGEGKLWSDGEIRPTREVLRVRGVEPLVLGPKSGLALINGTQFIAAHAVLLVEQFYFLLQQADLNAALMLEGLQGSAAPYLPELHALRPHAGGQFVASRIHHLLDGSGIVESHADCDRVQDPYSLRCSPQVHGASRQAWLHLKDLVETEINSVTDNPIICRSDLIVSGGHFHGQPLALPLDYACFAIAELGNIADRRAYLSLEGKTPGVPKLLLAETGVNSGFMIVQYTAAALVSENKTQCFPASADSIPTSLGQEDHVSMGSISGRKAVRVAKNVEKIQAVELLCAAQAIDFHRPLRSTPALEAVHARVREAVDFASTDRLFGEDILTLIRLLQTKDLHHICQEYLSDQPVYGRAIFEDY